MMIVGTSMKTLKRTASAAPIKALMPTIITVVGAISIANIGKNAVLLKWSRVCGSGASQWCDMALGMFLLSSASSRKKFSY